MTLYILVTTDLVLLWACFLRHDTTSRLLLAPDARPLGSVY